MKRRSAAVRSAWPPSRPPSRSADRRKRLGLVGVRSRSCAAVAVSSSVVVIGGGDDGGGEQRVRERPARARPVPAQKIDNLAEAARAAGCTVTESKTRAASHTGEPVEVQDQPADLGQPRPDPGRGRLLRADPPPTSSSRSTRSSTAGSTSSTSRARPRSRSRSSRRWSTRRSRARRLPHAGVPEPDGHEAGGGGHRVGPVADLRRRQRPGLRRAARVPRATASTRAPSSSRRPSGRLAAHASCTFRPQRLRPTVFQCP